MDDLWVWTVRPFLYRIKFSICQLMGLYKPDAGYQDYFLISLTWGHGSCFDENPSDWHYEIGVGKGLRKNWWFTDKSY